GEQVTAAWTSPWKKSRSPPAHARHAVSKASCASKKRPARASRRPRLNSSSTMLWSAVGMATILLCGVDLFVRGKLEALLPGHRFQTSEGVDRPDLVIADIARVDAVDVADSYPEVPIL